nr:ribonuclease H-like domain-containing protein [Tanacetum cinerariifolium]
MYDEYKALIDNNTWTKYATDIIEQAYMLNCNTCRTSIDTEKKLGHERSPVTDPTLYHSLTGSLQYLIFTRPDLSYAVQQLCLYMDDPREPHLNAMKHVLCYLRGTTDLRLQLFRSIISQLIAYSDADWAGSETCWIRNLLRELHTPLFTATLVYCDNVSAVYMFANPVQHQRTKHIEIDIHFVCDKVAAAHVRVLHVPFSISEAYWSTIAIVLLLFVDGGVVPNTSSTIVWYFDLHVYVPIVLLLADVCFITRVLHHYLELVVTIASPKRHFQDVFLSDSKLVITKPQAPIMIKPDWSFPFEIMCEYADQVIRRCEAGDEATQILRQCHNEPSEGHHGISTTARKVFEVGFYWPHIIEMHVNLTKAGENHFLQINELDEIRLDAYENSISYKERTKRWHEKQIKALTNYEKGDKILLFNLRLRLFPRKLKSRWYRPFPVCKDMKNGAIDSMKMEMDSS